MCSPSPESALSSSLKAPLRQHDDLAELLGAEAQDLDRLRRDPGPAGGQRLAVRAELSEAAVVCGRLETPERGVLRLAGDAVAAPLGAVLRRPAPRPVARRADGEVEGDLGEQFRLCLVAAHAIGRVALGAAGDSVEGERHGVEHGRLARAGGAVDEEEAPSLEVGEVQLLACGVGPERLHVQTREVSWRPIRDGRFAPLHLEGVGDLGEDGVLPIGRCATADVLQEGREQLEVVDLGGIRPVAAAGPRGRAAPAGRCSAHWGTRSASRPMAS